MGVQKDFTAACGCEIHLIKWSSKRDICSVKNCPLHKAAPKLLAALKEIAEWYGSWHENECPADDTCNCSGKPLNDRVNTAIREASVGKRTTE